MSEQTVSWRTKKISSVSRELKHELHEILILFLIDIVLPTTTTESPINSFKTCSNTSAASC